MTIKVGKSEGVKTLAAAIAQAIDGCTVQLAAGEIFDVPAGVEIWKNSITLLGPAVLRYSGPATRVDARGKTIVLSPSILSVRSHGVTIDSIKFDGGTSAQATAVTVGGATQTVLRNLDWAVTGGIAAKMYDFILLRGADGVLIEKCGSKKDKGCSKHWLYSAQQEVNGKDVRCRNVIVRNCVIQPDDSSKGIRIHRTDTMEVTGCTFLCAHARTAISACDGSDLRVHDNIINGNIGIEPLGDGDGGKNLPPGPAREAAMALRMSGVKIEKNTIVLRSDAGFAGAAISVGMGASGVSITGNTITTYASAAVFASIDDQPPPLKDRATFPYDVSGYLARGYPAATITGNTITGPAGCVAAKGRGMTASGNVVNATKVN